MSWKWTKFTKYVLGAAIGLPVALMGQYVARNLNAFLGTGVLPATCTVGDILFRSDMGTSWVVHGCLTTNHWSPISLPYGLPTVYWDDERVPVTSLAPGATPADVITYGPSGNVRVRGFDGNVTTESMEFTLQLPHSYKEGTDIYPHVHWAATSSNAGNVIWNLDYYWQNSGDALPALVPISTAATAASGTAWLSQYTAFPTINGTGKKISSMLIGRIYRVPTGSDTYADDAALLEIDFHIQKDALGSALEGAK